MNKPVTELIQKSQSGDAIAQNKLLPIIYSELKQIAGRHFSREDSSHTLQATALVHEAYFKLVGQNESIQNRSHFFALAAQAIRRVLVDHARSKVALKRGGHDQKTSFTDNEISLADQPLSNEDILDLNRALERLQSVCARQAQIVDLRYFSGFSIEETALSLKLSTATVKRDWLVARAWLARELDRCD